MASSQSELNAVSDLSQESSTLTVVYLQNPNDKLARVKARNAARNLFLELQDGDDAFALMTEQVAAACAIRYFLHIGLPGIMKASGPISAASLAEKLKCTPDFIRRMLRLVTAAGYLSEPEQDVFAHTKRSIGLAEESYAAFHSIMMDYYFSIKCWPSLPGYFDNNEKKSPDDPLHNPLNVAFGMDGKDWHDVVCGTPERMHKFHVALSSPLAAVPATGVYPFEKLEPVSVAAAEEGKTFMVDVGGVHGGTLLKIQAAAPRLKGSMIVQDQEKVIVTLPSGYLPSSVTAMVYDFWTPQPVKGAKVYYFRRILHDWPDVECAKILRNTAASMAPDSIVLVADFVLPDRVSRDDHDPSAYWMDMTMFMIAGRERTETDWKNLFLAAGLEVVKIWRGDGTHQGVVEGKKSFQRGRL